jgi:hypothetical protein
VSSHHLNNLKLSKMNPRAPSNRSRDSKTSMSKSPKAETSPVVSTSANTSTQSRGGRSSTVSNITDSQKRDESLVVPLLENHSSIGDLKSGRTSGGESSGETREPHQNRDPCPQGSRGETSVKDCSGNSLESRTNLTPLGVRPKSGAHYYNHHIIHVNCGVATMEQLNLEIHRAIQEAILKLGRPIETKFKTNIIVDRGGRRYGYGYVWFTNPEVYYMLIGKKPDGSDNVEYREDSDWVPPSDEKPSLEASLSSYLPGKSWVEIAEEEDRYMRPMLTIPLPPLMSLGEYQLDETQKRIWRPYFEGEILFDYKLEFDEDVHRDLMAALPTTPLLTLLRAKGIAPEVQAKIRKIMLDKADALGYVFDGTSVVPPDREKFRVSPAHVDDVETDVSHHILCGRYIPTWITEKDLKKIFTPYASDSVTLTRRKINGEVTQDTYPFVTINNKRIAFITFDSKTRDAQFALLMTRKMELSHGTEKVTVIFNQSYRSSSS